MSKTETPETDPGGHCQGGGDRRSKIALMILAKDEERNIGRILDAIASQTLIARKEAAISVYVIANGCGDRTAAVARESAKKSLHSVGVETKVFDWPTPGKSRSWNRVVHEVLPIDVNYVIALDADIEFVGDIVLATMFDQLLANPKVQVVSGFPVKATARKARPNLIDRFSMSISGMTRHSGVINGSLYLARATCLREIWLPDDTPGEDGFLNAMVMTRGFSRTEQPDAVAQLSEPSHYFEGHSPATYLAHETRMIVGTMINRWIFEHLHSLRLSEPAGPLIQRLNRDEPEWVERIIAERSVGRWLIPPALLFGRLTPKRGLTPDFLLRLPVRLVATALTLPPALRANRALKKRGASSLW